ncbi:MAG: hypothetical protein E6H07_13070 [Bacteroidetes bacterium]|nr:MAG: hypothetical protein E6H07_13070 [Bacteroidota bacterium]
MGTSTHLANIFTGPAYSGSVKYITRTGWYSLQQDYPEFENNISSITTSILNTIRVILFSDPFFTGKEMVVENDWPSLPVMMENKCSSLLVELKTEQHVEIFQNNNYSGLATSLFGMSYRHLSDFFPNDALSSIRIPYGKKVYLYEHEDYRGRKIILDKDTPFIGEDFNNRVTSMQILNYPIAFSDPNFQGRSQMLELDSYDSAPERGSRWLEIGDNAIRSLKISYPFLVKAFPEKHFGGERTIYKHDIENIPGTISSLAIEPSFR